MVHEAQPVYKMIMKNVSRWKKKEKEQVEVAELSFVMSKTDMIKKGLCFKCGKQGHKAYECNNNRGGTKSAEDEHGSGQQHMQT
jgi:hypothetical protein